MRIWICYMDKIADDNPIKNMYKAPFNNLIRWVDTDKFEDNVELGNRVLASWVGKYYYHPIIRHRIKCQFHKI